MLVFVTDPDEVFYALHGYPECRGDREPILAVTEWGLHPLWSRFQRALYKAIRKEEDASFLVRDRGDVCLIVQGTVKDGVFSNYGLPALIESIGPPNPAAVLMAVKHMKDSFARAIYRGPWDEPAGIPVPCEESITHATIDLSLLTTTILARMDHGTRRNVRWGQDNLALMYMNRQNQDRSLLDRYIGLYSEVSGVAYPEGYWDVYYREICTLGAGELTLGYLQDGTLAAGCITIDGRGISYYASGAYLRTMGRTPLSHWPVANAALRAKERGKKVFDVGEVPEPKTVVVEKLATIGSFKRGFTPDSMTYAKWTVGTQRLDGTQETA